jgi:predicted hotdog family 3-hydroxylacyl-ACP dehydratase
VSAFPPVEQLLPHRAPLLLLDEVVAWEPGRRVTARHVVRADEPFARGGRVPALVALEYMAQAVGLYAGLQARERGLPVKVGFLVACREMRCDVSFFLGGDELLLDAAHVWGDERLGQFRCTTRYSNSDGAAVAQAVVSVYSGPLGDAGSRG